MLIEGEMEATWLIFVVVLWIWFLHFPKKENYKGKKLQGSWGYLEWEK